MPNPIIKLKFNQKLDQDLAWEFFNNQEIGGCNFWQERALNHHPKLLEIESSKNAKVFLNKYIFQFYNFHFDELEKLSKKTSIYLDESQNYFFKVVDKIFNHYPWPKKKFTGFFSIFDFCPRFLDDGSFQIFLYDNKKIQLFTIFHEMLHFIFYDFVQITFSKKFKHLNTEEGKFWDLSEIFNAVLQDTEDFIKLHGKIKNIGYPNHRKLIMNGKKIWKNNQDLSQWIIEMSKLMGIN
ncbi:hypothetical protein H6761_02130 [Candidatus Nomurabacteria bacterium]|nr:hypothetical protein [Candidatus Nomurabacteria bacterium]